jgi:heme exporter protein D
MMPDLGPYAFPVLGAYGVAIALIGGLVVASVVRAARVRRALARLESGRKGGERHGDG